MKRLGHRMATTPVPDRCRPGERKGRPTPKQVKRDLQHPDKQHRHLCGAAAGRRG